MFFQFSTGKKRDWIVIDLLIPVSFGLTKLYDWVL
jgi:hypothetical protein